MKKVIGIYCGGLTYNYNKKWDSTVVRTEPCGGSETWTVEVASKLNSYGFHVIVFCNCEYWHFDQEGIEYVPYTLFRPRCGYQHFDYFISSRLINGIIDELSCDNIYIMTHERCGIFDKYWGNFAKPEDIPLDRVKKVVVLSEWNKRELLKAYPNIPENKIMVTFNGIDTGNYDNVEDYEKSNKMLWSTCLDRGITFFGEYVIDKIKAEVPDFELGICSYNTDIHGAVPERDWIKYYGPLTKDVLSEYQKESKIWILPNYGFNDRGEPLQESCPLTAIENMYAENAIVCWECGGTADVLKGYSGMLDSSFLTEHNPTDEEKEQLGRMLADNAIKILKDDNYRKSLVRELKKIRNKYTWENSAITWIKEWIQC